MIEALLNSRVTSLVVRFARKKGFKIKKPIYVRNINGTFNEKGLIKYIVEMNIYYQRYRERIEISGQK